MPFVFDYGMCTSNNDMLRAVKLIIPDKGISRLNPALWIDTVVDSAKMAQLHVSSRELHGEITPIYASTCVFFVTGIKKRSSQGLSQWTI